MMKYSPEEGKYFCSIPKVLLKINRPKLPKIAGCEFFYTEGKSDLFSVAICSGNDCRILYNEGLLYWIGQIKDFTDIDILYMTDVVYQSVIIERTFKFIKKLGSIDTRSPIRLKDMFMGDFFQEGESYIKACLKTLGYFYFATTRKGDVIWTEALLCAVLDNILIHDIDKYKNEDYYVGLAKKYNVKLQSVVVGPTSFKTWIHTELKRLMNHEKHKFIIDRKKPDGTRQVSIDEGWKISIEDVPEKTEHSSKK